MKKFSWGCEVMTVCVRQWYVVAMVSTALSWSGLSRAQADNSGAQVLGPRQVVASGVVPDEATRAQVMARLRELYGAERVVDQLSLGAVVAPPQWSQHLQKMLSPSLRQVTRGQLSVQGNTIDIKGDVANEAQRQQVASDMAAVLNPTYTIRNGLRVAAQEQVLVDQTLANRIVEFEPGSAVLRPAGVALLDEMARTLSSMKDKRVLVIGHTDAQGGHAANVALSQARADAVRTYLISRGLSAGHVSTVGVGPDRPVASNATEAGRARNRRIEFQIVQ